MASETKEVEKSETKTVQKTEDKGLRNLLRNEAVMGRFSEIMKDRAPAFITSIINVSESNNTLKQISEKNPMSIIRAAAVAASLDLPIDKNLGFSWIVPYKGDAQFQMGWKGFVQLAQRSGKYAKINCTPIGKNEYKSWNPLTEDLGVVFQDVDKGDIVGFVMYFELINGFKKTAYYTKSALLAHGKRYSQSFKNGPWQTHEDEMCMKTAVKITISKWGILSIDMQRAQTADQAIIVSDDITKETSFVYVDNLEATNGTTDPITMPEEIIPEADGTNNPEGYGK